MGHHLHGHGHAAGGGIPDWLPPALLLIAACGVYLLLVRRACRRNPVLGWSRWRTGWFLGGILLLGVALLPPVAPFAHEDFRGHMVQHLLIGMYAPLALVLAAPVTLLLRTLPASRGRRLTAVLHSLPARVISHPAVGLALSTGGLAVLYFTPLYNAITADPAAHWLLHAHFLLSGCLFAHAVAGPDPAPARPGVRARLVYLGVAIAAHAVISQLMYGGFWADIHAPIDQVQGGAEVMYYGGDLAELLLAAALVATWRPEPRRAAGRRAVSRGAVSRSAADRSALGRSAGRGVVPARNVSGGS
ncbi:putative membrane protein [Streptomyces sp. Ag82_O1-12]|uniref:cytochrome c oxidase assembly protein n=1 Tax=unclassified Streptomyces TaxID=2593676 RepID=UPI000BC6E06B|nr:MULTISPECIES: cytochrome c oxidase assembly protein [unclassified Streptomyces]SMQ19867.1 putative membrane protein [Streptomyces sp. Ag82_O1-12]SOD48903.1 putative membrane protein [Streptomyces sp. Ag82_G6-1]